jgi:Uma2 family endonuclease
MSAARSQPQEFGLAGLRMRAEDYFALGETQERYELIDGVVMMSPSPRPRHWKAAQEIILQLGLFVRTGGTADVYGETDLQINDRWVFRPDVCVYAVRPAAVIPERLTAAPDLVVEVLSPGTQALDLITKRDEYERSGVKEYWIVDPLTARVRAWRWERGQLIEAVVEGGTLASAAIPGFALDLRARAAAVGVS